MSFDDKSVIVTGGGSGMGRASAIMFAERGASVLVADINGDAAQQTVDTIERAGGTAVAHAFDLREREGAFGLVQTAVDRFGGLDVLANVGGISQNRSVDEMDVEFWQNMQDVNARGNLFTMQAAVAPLRETRGSIVNVASGAAFYAIPGLAAYGASKAALVAVGRAVAQENAPLIRVNTIAPGPTQTAMAASKPTAAVAAARAKVDQAVGRWLDPTEIADVIVWVSSEAARAVNGAILRVDGGHRML